MNDGALQSTMDNYEYPIIAVSRSDRPGTTVDNLARSLFKKLKDIAARDSSLSVSIEAHGSNPKESPAWVVTVESPSKIIRYSLNEFCFPYTEGPKLVDYFFWILRAPVRAANYLAYRAISSVGTGSRRQRARALVRLLPDSVMLAFEVVTFFYFIPIISFTVIRPLRGWSLRMLILYCLAIATVVLLSTWESFLPPFVAWVSQFSHRLVDLVPGTGLSFDLVFPVMATIMFGVTVSIIVAVIGVVRQAIRRADERAITPQGAVDLAYLLDPLYSATTRRAFEESLLKVGSQKESQILFVICEHGGILLAYEVLSRMCPSKISKPIHMLTHKMDVASLLVGMRTMLWLLVEPNDWSRFARTTPDELSWHYWTPRPSGEFIYRIDWAPEDKFPQVQREPIHETSWFKSSYSMLLDRLITLSHQA